MKPGGLRNFLFGTLRGRLILSVALVHAVMMTLFISDLTIRQSALLLENRIQEAGALAQTLATSASGWVASSDISGLQELVEADLRYPEIQFAIITDQTGRILAHTDRSKLGLYLLDLPQDIRQVAFNQSPDLVDVAAPAMIGSQLVGWARVGIGQEQAAARQAEITRMGILYALVTILIGSLIAWFMGRQITHRLYAVQDTMGEVRKGEWAARARIGGTDEVASIANEFNFMLDTLEDRDLALQESETKFRVIFENSVDAIGLSKAGVHVFVNPAYLALFGYARNDELIGKSILDLIAPDERQQIALNVQRRLGGEDVSPYYETRGLRKDGSQFAMEVHVSVYTFQGEQVTQVILRDITERRRVEAERIESEANLHALINNRKESIWSIDENYAYITFNDFFARAYLAAYQTELKKGINAVAILPPELREFWKLKYDATLAGQRSVFEFSSRIENEDHLYEVSLNPIAANGKVSGVTGLSVDITRRKQAEDELRQNEEQYRRLINSLPSGVIVHHQGQIMLVNRAGIQSLGAKEPEQLIGTALLDRIHPDWHEMVRSRLIELQQEGREVVQVEEKLIRLDGSMFDAEVATIALTYPGGAPSTLTVFNDITQRRQRERELLAIASLSAALRSAPTRAEMLPRIVEQLIYLFNCDTASIEIIDSASGDVVLEAAEGVWKSLVGSHQKKGEGINSIINQTRRPYIVQDLEHDPHLAYPGWAYKNLHSGIGMPLLAEEELIGFIWVGHAAGIVEFEARLLEAIADIAANAIHRATLHELTQKDAAELALAYDRTLEGWAGALELRDQETEGHSWRVVKMILDLARTMGIAEEEMETIRRGALLHDIGKMGIPDSVLLKPGTLNEREWEIMRRHPEYAYKLLSRIDYVKSALEIPYCHHEKWDGSGYPRGLKGCEIPLNARIFAVVDVWDALTSDRPYRLAWTNEEALAYIREQSGKHFDPAVVEAFLKLAPTLAP